MSGLGRRSLRVGFRLARQSDPSHFLVGYSASTLLAAQALLLCRRRNAASGPGGREERSLSFPLTATEKQGNNSLKANHYPWVMLCPTLWARYY